jgi:hypothetical protein
MMGTFIKYPFPAETIPFIGIRMSVSFARKNGQISHPLGCSQTTMKYIRKLKSAPEKFFWLLADFI